MEFERIVNAQITNRYYDVCPSINDLFFRTKCLHRVLLVIQTVMRAVCRCQNFLAILDPRIIYLKYEFSLNLII